jgi:gamma-resorcylate decarboxylase
VPDAEEGAVRGKIAIEEHFVTPGLERCIAAVGWPAPEWRRVLDALEDTDRRLREMDELGIEVSVLSLGSDGIQSIPDPDEAIATAREANDALAEIVAARPDRFQGFAALPLQDPDAAIDELRRAVDELGFRGAMVNGFSEVGDAGTAAYYDQPEYEPFWEAVADLGVPFYLHPRNPLESQRRIYEGRSELLGPTWAFGVETGTHALRLITSGLFDRVPGLQVILGHLGENLPFAIARLEQRLSHRTDVTLVKSPRTVLREHFHVTVSGNYHTPSLLAVMLELGADRLLFAADHPFEAMADAAVWFDALPISDADKEKIGAGNARRLLSLRTTDHEGTLR